MKIAVTAEDIAKGVSWHYRKCPIALAARRIGFRSPVVVKTLSESSADGPFAGKRYDLPPEALRFLHRFDVGGPVEPFEFEAEELP